MGESTVDRLRREVAASKKKKEEIASKTSTTKNTTTTTNSKNTTTSSTVDRIRQEVKESQAKATAIKNGTYKKTDATNNVASNSNKSTYGDVIKQGAWTGLTGWNSGLAKTADFLLPNVITPKAVQKVLDYYKNTGDEEQEKLQNISDTTGKSVVGNLVSGTVRALPDAVLSVLSAPSKAVEGIAATTEALTSASEAKTLSNLLQNAVTKQAKNPMFWTSFNQITGETYDDEIKNGASEAQATASALLNGILGSTVEIGGGIQTYTRPNNLKEALRQWGKQALEEGREEIDQYTIQNLASMATGAKDATQGNNWFSLDKNQDAVINPLAQLEQGAYGAAVGGLLGGQQLALDTVVNQEEKNAIKNDLVNRGATNKEANEVSNIVKKITQGYEVTDKEAEKVANSVYAVDLLNETTNNAIDINDDIKTQVKSLSKYFTTNVQDDNTKAIRDYANTIKDSTEREEFIDSYETNQDPTSYIESWAKWKKAGKDGTSVIDNVLTDSQKMKAYAQGAKESNNGVRLQNSEEWNNTESTEATRKVVDRLSKQSFTAGYQRAAKDTEAYQATASQQVKFNDSSITTEARLVTSNFTPKMRKAIELGLKDGYQVRIFVGGNIIAKDGTENRALVTTNNGVSEIWIRGDDPDFTADKLYKHEGNHPKIRIGSKATPFRESLKERIIEKNGDATYKHLLETYKEVIFGYLYDDQRFKDEFNMTAEEYIQNEFGVSVEEYIEDEMLCDLVAGMNVFEGYNDYIANQYKTTYERSARTAERMPQETRGPPADTLKDERRFSFTGFTDWNKETKNNLKLQKVIRINTEEELERHIEDVLSGKEKKKEYSLGAVEKSTLDKIEKDINSKIFKDRQYSFIISSDSILHIYEHFNNVKDVKQEILKIHSMVDGYDSVEHKMQGDQKLLLFEKDFDDASRRTVEVVSNNRNSLNLKTTYWSKKNKSQSYLPANSSNVGSQQGSTLKKNISQKAEENNTSKERFSMAAPVERKGNLVAVHNMTVDELEKSMNLGGLPMPSIAVIKAEQGHSMYGDVSLIFDSKTIDPKASKNNKIYGMDAWTPTYPAVEYKLSKEVNKNVFDKVFKTLGKDLYYDLHDKNYDYDNMQSYLNQSGGNLASRYEDDTALRYAFLKETGKEPKLQYRTPNYDNGHKFSNEEVVKFAKNHTLEELQEINNLSWEERKNKLKEEAYNIKKEYLEEKYKDVETKLPGARKKVIESQLETIGAYVDSLMYGAMKYLREGETQVVDKYETASYINPLIEENRAEYDKWLNDLFDGAKEKEGLRNNQDYFTNSGNRRSWEALHWEHNLENVVKIMRSQEDVASDAFFSAAGIWGVASKSFNNLDEVRQDSYRLYKMSEEEYDKARDNISTRLTEVVQSMMNEHGDSNHFIAFDNAASALVEALRNNKTKSGLMKELQSYRALTVTKQQIDDIVDIVHDIQAMPTGYFEAKPKRAVEFEEVRAAIVPDDTPQSVIDRIKEYGTEVVTFKKNDEEDRKAKLNEITETKGLRFSKAVDSEGNKLTEGQVKYFKNSKVRDENGNLLVVYHGTRNPDFTVFNRNINYYTSNQAIANSYNPNGEKLYKGYVNIKKPFIVDAQGERWSKIPISNEIYQLMNQYGESTFEEDGKPRTSTNDIAALVQDLIEDGESYDGIIILNVEDTGNYGNGKLEVGNDYITFDSNQFKNFDNENPTENPDIRFSKAVDSEGNKLTEGQIKYFKDSKVRDENGNLLLMYHGTQEEFTVFNPKGYRDYEVGFNWATPYFDLADAFAGGDEARFYGEEYGSVIEGYVNITNPLDIGEITTESEEDFKRVAKLVGMTQKELEDLAPTYMLFEATGSKQFMDKVLSLGYDGVKAEEDGITTYGFADSNQFKESTNENPTKKKDIRFSKALDEEYLKLAKEPEKNKEKLQRMVDEAAKANGYNIKGYHGTYITPENFGTIIDDVLYMAKSREIANTYGYNVYEFYGKMSNPLILDAEGNVWDELSRSEDILEWVSIYHPQAVPNSFNEGYYDISTRVIEDYAADDGHDGVIIRNIIDSGSTKNNDKTDIAFFYSNSSVKSADPVTYDDNGNIIPLSQRFNDKNIDIRFSKAVTEGQKQIQEIFPNTKDAENEFFSEGISLYRTEVNQKNQKVVQLQESRIDRLLREYGSKSNEKYAKAYIGQIDINDYLSLTLDDSQREEWNQKAQSGTSETLKPLDIEKLSNEIQTPFLIIEGDSVIGHEGRHRARALLEAGYEKMPIAIIEYGNKYDKTPTKIKKVFSQDFGNGAVNDSYLSFINYLIPLNPKYEPAIKEMYGKGGGIRYSKVPTYTELAQENAELKDKLKVIKDLTKENAELRRNLAKNAPTEIKSGTYRIAQQLIKDNNSDVNVQEVATEVRALANRILRGDNGLVVNDEYGEVLYDDIKNDAAKIAYKIVSNASVLTNEEGYKKYKDLKKYFTINTKKNIDSKWSEMVQLFNFPSDTETVTEGGDTYNLSTVEDKIRYVQDTLERLAPIYNNPYSVNMAEATESVANRLTNDILDGLFNDSIKEMPKSVVDKYEAKISKLEYLNSKNKAEYRKSLEEANKRALERLQAEANKRRKQAQDYKEKDSRKELLSKVEKKVKTLDKKLLQPTDKSHIPQDLKGAVAKALSVINRESVKNPNGPTKQTWNFIELKNKYKEYASEMSIDESLEDYLNEIEAWEYDSIYSLSSSQLRTIYNTLRAIEASIGSFNRTFYEGRYQTISDWANKLYFDTKGKDPKVWKFNKSRQLLTLDMYTPETYFTLLGEDGYALFRELRDAQDKFTTIVKETKDFTTVVKESTGIDVKKLKEERVNVELGKDKVSISKAQLMNLYCLVERGPQAVDHILEGGIKLDNPKAKRQSELQVVKNIRMKQLTDAFSVLTAKEIAACNLMQMYLSTRMSEYGNEASMRVYGYEKFGEATYWPIKVNRDEINANPAEEQKNIVTTWGSRGFTKLVKPNANQSVLVGDVFEVFSTHANDMAGYAAYLAVCEDLSRVYNYRDKNFGWNVKGDVLDKTFGNGGSYYLAKLIRDICMGSATEGTYFSGMVGKWKQSAVGANLRVVVQQPTAILRATDMIDAKYFLNPKNVLKGWEKAKKYAPIAQWKDWGYFDINTGKSLSEILFGPEDKLSGIAEATMKPAAFADSVSWGMLWNACENEIKDKNPKLKGEEFYKKVAERFTEIVDHTQVVDGILQRSQIMRSSNPLNRMATSFMGEPTKSYNMLVQSAYNFTVNKKKNSGKLLARTVIVYAVAASINAVAQSLVDGLRDDDKEKKYWEKFFDNLVGDYEDADTLGKWFTCLIDSNLFQSNFIIQNIPYLKDVWSMIQGYTVERQDLESISDVISSATALIKAISGNGKKTIVEASIQFAAEIGRFFGIGASNLKRDIKAVLMTIAIESDNYMLQFYMDKAMLKVGYTSNKAEFASIMTSAYASGDKESYNKIRAELKKEGYTDDYLDSKIKAYKKENPTEKQQSSYDKLAEKIEKTVIYKTASEDRRNDLMDNLYKYEVGIDDRDTQSIKKAVNKSIGFTEEDYILYKLALEMVDEPNANGKLGTYTVDEKRAAAMECGFDSEQRHWIYTNFEG